MKKIHDEIELSHIENIGWKIIDENTKELKLDIYYNSHGYPKYVHDSFGENEVNKFRIFIVNEILNKNSVENIWRVSSDAFAIAYNELNCNSFKIDYKGIEHNILKKTIIIKTYEE